MEEECKVCGAKNEPIYAHCRNCLEANQPNGTHEVSWDDTWVYVNCANCGKLVCKFVKLTR